MRVFNKGIALTTTPSNSNSGFNVPTNPVLIDDAGLFATANFSRIAAYITEDGTGSAPIVIEQASSAGTQYNNLSTTEGYRIKCFDDATQTGFRINAFDFDSYDYFVLIHSDDYLQHHFAKLTQSLTEDVSGDAFEFEPRLGNEIAKDTKFMLYRVENTSKIVALSIGLLSQTSYSNKNRMFCSRPHFYFYNDKLDKKNELDHNKKYEFKMGGHVATTSPSTTLTIGDTTTAITVPDFGTKIIDYSKYELNVTLSDNLRTIDSDAYSNGNNDGFSSTWSHGGTNYETSFYNARRELDDRIILDGHATNSDIEDLAGPYRYVHYDFSPNKCNSLSNVMSNQIYDSIGGKGGLCETKMIDPAKILGKKINEFDEYKARHRVFKAKLDEWVDTGITYNSYNTATADYSFDTINDLQPVTPVNLRLFGVYDELLIGDRIYIVGGKQGAVSGGIQKFVLHQTRLKDTEDFFSSIGSNRPTEGEKVYRRAYSRASNNILTTFSLVPNRTNLKIKIAAGGFNFIEGDVSATDTELGLMAVTFDNAAYFSDNSLDYAKGTYYIEIERFNGEIETIDAYHDKGQTFMEISGRDKFNKLLSPIVNKDTLFSTDIIYSSNSPYNKVTALGVTATCDFDSKTVTASGSVTVSDGDRLYIETDATSQNLIYLGEVASNSTGTSITLVDFANTRNTNGNNLYKSSNKNYVFNKALSSNHLDTSVSSLLGAANKGVFFDGGVVIGSNGAEGELLGGSSISDNPEAVGYYISETIGIESDNYFQARLDDDDTSSRSYYTNDIINTLLDFNVLSVKKDDFDNTVLEIAPHIPLTLGRVDVNFANTQDTTFSTTTLGTCASASNSRFLSIDISDAPSAPSFSEPLSSISNPRKYHKKPIYIDGTFVGMVVLATFHNNYTIGSETIRIYLDREVTTSGGTVQALTYANSGETSKLTHELNLLNGGHLHTGKIISLVSPLLKTDNSESITGHYDFAINFGGTRADSYTTKMGVSQYRIYNLEKGNYSSTIHPIIRSSNDTNTVNASIQDYYSQIPSSIRYYASAYKFGASYRINSGAYLSGSVGVGLTSDEDNTHTLIETRGNQSPLGSRFWDREFITQFGYIDMLYPANPSQTSLNVATVDSSMFHPHEAKTYMSLNDPKVSRMFLFSNSDLLPYSSTRKDSLMQKVVVGGASYNNDPTITHTSSNIITVGMTVSGDGIPDGATVSSITSSTEFELSVSTTGGSKSSQTLTFTQPRDLTKYSVLALKSPTKGNRSDVKANANQGTTTMSLTDNDFQSGNIISAEKTINSLKRFSMMRLTEVVLDWAFNQIDPENVIENNKTIPKFQMGSFNGFTDSGITLQSSDASLANFISGNTITKVGSGHPFVAEDILCDTNGRYIGRINTITGSSPNITITLRENAFKTDGLNYFTSANVRRIPASEYRGCNNNLFGVGKSDSFVKDEQPIHMLKSAVMQKPAHYNSGVQAGYGDNNSVFYSQFNNFYIGGGNGTTSDPPTGARVANIFLPVRIGSVATPYTPSVSHTANGTVSHTNFPSLVLQDISNMETHDGGAIGSGTGDELYKRFLPVIFDRFSIEDGGGSKADIGMVGGQVETGSIRIISPSSATNDAGLIGLALENNFADKDHIDDTGTRTYDKTADGVIFGFKPQLRMTSAHKSSASTSLSGVENKTVGDKDVHTYLIGAVDGQLWLNHFDLTGCYLVSNDVTKLNDAGVEETKSWGSINDGYPTKICYVISHEVNILSGSTQSATKEHIIILDTEFDHNNPMRIMQPNHTCFHSFGPKTIIPNFMSSSYTKKPRENKMYEAGIINFGIHDKTGDDDEINNDDAVQSMYVIVDPDRQTTSDYLVLRKNKIEDLISDIDHTMCLSDGDTMFKTSVNYVGGTDSFRKGLVFDEMKTLLGVTSISETMNITVNNEINTDVKRLMIGTVAHISSESEVIVNDLLEENDITFNLTKADYPLFIAPNFQGVDLYSALNLILNKKNKQLTVEEGVFTIKDDDDNSYYSRIIISDTTRPQTGIGTQKDFEIYDYKKLKSTLDFYNEIIVYGNKFRSIRKDIKSIQKRGKKTLEVVENELFSQKEVDERATELLHLHSKLNSNRYKVTIGHKNISQIKVGDIIGFELKRENIPLAQYMVLEIEHELLGNMTLTLGRYHKALDDRFAELLVGNKKLNANIRRKEFSDSLLSFDILDEIKIKPLRLLVRKRFSTGSFKLGFGTTLNTGTTQLGFVGGASVTITDLIDEELT